jgi:hypothetical protein
MYTLTTRVNHPVEEKSVSGKIGNASEPPTCQHLGMFEKQLHKQSFIIFHRRLRFWTFSSKFLTSKTIVRKDMSLSSVVHGL